MSTLGVTIDGGSFRDPSGFVFERYGVLLRQINKRYGADYAALTEFFEELTRDGLLIRHDEVALSEAISDEAYAVIKPERVPFVSYPYEWCFSQLKDAALTTLEIQRRALTRGFALRDASAYNIQWLRGRPVLIDTLSLASVQYDKPWVAYRQFCQHFLGPLLLASCTDVRLGALLMRYVDGIPLDLTSRLLPARTWARWGALLHVHLHARSHVTQPLTTPRARNPTSRQFSQAAHEALVDSLMRQVASLRWTPTDTQWSNYEHEHNYSTEAVEAKEAAVRQIVRHLRPKVVWDLGANIGRFSRIAAEAGAEVLSIDAEPAAVEQNFIQTRTNGEQRILPLLIDLSAPSPSIGWNNKERGTLQSRGKCDLVLALALVHHLAIGGNVPLGKISSYLASLGDNLLIEFVPKTDSQLVRMLSTREDIFSDYTERGFASAFSPHWIIRSRMPIDGSVRVLYHMEKHAV